MIFPRFSSLYDVCTPFCLLVNKLHTRKSLNYTHVKISIKDMKWSAFIKKKRQNQYLSNACELATWGMNNFLSDSLQTPLAASNYKRN